MLGRTSRLAPGAMSRVAPGGEFASSWRWGRSQQLRNGKRQGQGNPKNGKKYWAWALVEAANFAVLSTFAPNSALLD